MKLHYFNLFSLVAVYFQTTSAYNILLTSEDSWVSTNLRATYQSLKSAGHNVIVLAPTRSFMPFQNKINDETLTQDGEFQSLKKGEWSFGPDPEDDNIWFLDASVVECVQVALDVLIPDIFSNITIDLVIAGPKAGSTVGEFSQITSPSLQAVKTATLRGIPAISVSVASRSHTYYKNNLGMDPLNPYNIYGSKLNELIGILSNSDAKTTDMRLLPKDVSLNINFPIVGYESQIGCLAPSFVMSRSRGGYSISPKYYYDEEEGKLFSKTSFENMEDDCITNGGNVKGQKEDQSKTRCQYPAEISLMERCAISITPLTTNSDTYEDLSYLLHPKKQVLVNEY